MSRTPQFVDAASPVEDVVVNAGDAHLQISGYVKLLIQIVLLFIKLNPAWSKTQHRSEIFL